MVAISDKTCLGFQKLYGKGEGLTTKFRVYILCVSCIIDPHVELSAPRAKMTKYFRHYVAGSSEV